MYCLPRRLLAGCQSCCESAHFHWVLKPGCCRWVLCWMPAAHPPSGLVGVQPRVRSRHNRHGLAPHPCFAVSQEQDRCYSLSRHEAQPACQPSFETLAPANSWGHLDPGMAAGAMALNAAVPGTVVAMLAPRCLSTAAHAPSSRPSARPAIIPTSDLPPLLYDCPHDIPPPAVLCLIRHPLFMPPAPPQENGLCASAASLPGPATLKPIVPYSECL